MGIICKVFTNLRSFNNLFRELESLHQEIVWGESNRSDS